MQRHLLGAILLVLTASSVGHAQDWARKMFTATSHDFGTVAHAAKVEYAFEFSNPYKETAHVMRVYSSCGCTSPECTKDELQTFEKSSILAKFNTRSFTGHHGATITVIFDKPYYAEVQLSVTGDIRGDVSVEPSLVELGTIEQGQGAKQRITVTRNGRGDWQISDVRSLNTNYAVEVVAGPRTSNQVSYDLIVTLKKECPPGYLHDQLYLVTNDPGMKQFPIEVEGRVQAALNVSPPNLAFGAVEAGQQVTKQLVVGGARPFRVTGVRCDDPAFSYKVVSPAAAKVQIVEITLTAPNKAGKLSNSLRVETDLGQSVAVEVGVQADVSAAPRATTDDHVVPPSDTAKPKSDLPKIPASDSGVKVPTAKTEGTRATALRRRVRAADERALKPAGTTAVARLTLGGVSAERASDVEEATPPATSPLRWVPANPYRTTTPAPTAP